MHSDKPNHEELENRIKELEKALRENEARFQLLYDKLPLGYQSLDENGCFIEVNQSWLDHLGYSREEVIGKSFAEFLHPDWKDHFKINFPRFKALGEVLGVEFEMVKKDGALILVSFNGKISRDRSGEFVQTHCIFHDITSQRKTEEKLKAHDEDLKESQRIAHVGSWRMDIKTGQVAWSEELYHMFGLDPALPVPPYTEHYRLFTPESWERLTKALPHTIETGIPYEIELETLRQDKTRGWMWVRGEAVHNEQGIMTGLRGAAQDITDRKLAEEQYRTIIQTAQSGFWITGTDGEILDVNNAYCRMSGYTREELLTTNVADIEALESPEGIQSHLNLVMEKGHDRFLTKHRKKDGTLMDVDISVTYMMGKKGRFYAFLDDVTEHLRNQETLRETQLIFDRFMEHSPVYVFFKDKDIRPIRLSKNYEQMLGMPLDHLLGKTMDQLFPSDLAKSMIEDDKKILNKGKNVEIEEELNGRHYFTTKFPIFINGKPQYLAGYTIDITERRQAEEERLHTQKIISEQKQLALVGQVAGKMAHDFNNILGIIMGNVELGLIDCPDHSTRKTLELIYEQTVRGKNLTRNLVAFAKDQEPKQVFFPIEEKMDLVITLLKKDLEGIRVVREYSSGLPDVLADPGMIEHAMVNLIQNSIHAVSLSEEPCIIIRTYAQNERIFLEIEDNGCGIPREHMREIFDPSFTLKGSRDKAGLYKPGIKGTGYGMSNVRKYVEQHKGKISVLSELQKGTTITIDLPVIQKTLTRQEITDIQKGPLSSGRYILLVEDEPAIADVQYRILTQAPCGHQVDIAANGQMAMDLLDRNDYDLVSLDYILPGSISGMDVYHYLRKKQKTVPVVFISGNIEFIESLAELKHNDPQMDHLSKPCKNMDYISSINHLLKRHFKT